MLDPMLATDGEERQRKNACADEDEHGEGGQPGGSLHR